MLRSFQLANHRSVRDEQELNLLAVYDETRQVVPVAAVFGANASGKSNLLDGLRWMRSAVLDSYRTWEAESKVPREPYRLDPEARKDPSSFVVDLTIGGVEYIYGFVTDDQAIVEEWLYSYPHNRERVIFRRDRQSVELGSTLPERRGRAELLGGLLRKNALLLSTAVQANQQEMLPVYRWFRDNLRLGGSFDDLSEGDALVDYVENALSRFPGFNDLVRVADLGISELEVEGDGPPRSREELEQIGRLLDIPEPEMSFFVKTLRADRRRSLIFRHGVGQVSFSWSDQSEGTRSWIRLLIPTLASLEDGAVVVVDEVDASLHPRLTARLIELFRNESTNTGGAQLLFTTHDATLLGTQLGEEVLRRDEIWFIEKRDGSSRLYPLSDFHPRKGENRERRYLAGSYGAVPVVFTDSLVKAVLASRAEEPDAEA